MSLTEIPLKQRLYFKQAKYMLLIALSLGLLFSSLQIAFDYVDTCNEAQRTALDVLEIGKTPALQAAYNFDTVLAQGVVHGISKYRLFYQVTLQNEYTQVMAEEKRELAQVRWAWLAQRLFQSYSSYAVKLKNEEHEYGVLKAEVDIFLLAESFAKRTRLTIVSGLL